MTAASKHESPVVVTRGNNSNRFTKIALIILAVVFLVVLSEVAYLIFAKGGFSLFNEGETSVQENNERLSTTSQPQPTTAPNQKNQENVISLDIDKVRAFADMLDYLVTSGKEESLDIATIYYEISGVVIASDFDKKEVGDITYVYRLLLREQNGKILPFRLGEEEVINAQVLLVSSSRENKISISDIKPDDIVVIKATTNLLDANSHLKVVLEVTR